MGVQSTALANRLREVSLNGKWVTNTNLKEVLEDVDLELATKKLGDHNSIAALTFHIGYYIGGVLNVLKGGNLEIRDKFSFDMPAISDEAGWMTLKRKVFRDAEEFAQAIEHLMDDQLTKDFVDEKYGSYQRNIDAMIEHGYYHLGQIVLLKKLLSN